MSVDLSKTAFYSDLNYMKRDTSSGSFVLTIPSAGGSETLTVSHSFGYVPFFQVLCDIDDDGTIWSATKIHSLTGTSLTGASPSVPTLRAWATTTDLVIRIDNDSSPAASGTVTVYYILYRDYGNA